MKAADALVAASALFRGLPLKVITEEELAHNTPDPSLHAKTTSLALGTCDAFVSHSWSDDGHSKFTQLHGWAAGEEKQIWLESVRWHSNSGPVAL